MKGNNYSQKRKNFKVALVANKYRKEKFFATDKLDSSSSILQETRKKEMKNYHM